MRFLAIGLLITLCSCSTVTKVAPRFDKPSVKPISVGVTKATASVRAAQAKAAKLEQEVVPALKLQVVSLQSDLDDALKQLAMSQGATAQLDQQLSAQTTKANQLADNYDKAASQISSLKVSRHRWVKYFTIASALLGLSALWILRKPILLLLAGTGI